MRTDWRTAIVFGCLASGAALVLQNWLRDMWQVRALPERVMEWLLLFIPLDLFEHSVGQLGQSAKEVALVSTISGMALLLTTIGGLAMRAGSTSWELLGLGVVMWLVTMGIVMPITGAGFFASDLLISPLLTSVGFLLVFLTFASVLIVGRLLSIGSIERRQVLLSERRALLVGMLGTLASSAVTRFLGREGGLVASTLPLASAQAPEPAPTEAPPQLADPTQPAVSSIATPTSPAVQPAPTLEPMPVPPPPRRLARDKDGSLTAAGRTKGELSPLLSSNDDFYIVTKNAVADPMVDPVSWRLVIDGEVNRPVQIDYRTLRALPAVEVIKTLECISNFTTACTMTTFGCDLISTARWKGARLSDVLALAGGLKSSVGGLAFVSADEFSAGLPPDVADDPQTLVVYEMNGQTLPREHGYPARLLVPGRYGLKNPKWLAGIRAMTQEYAGWYEQRNWSKDAFVKTMARIDVPLDGAKLASGAQRLAGIAYAGDRGLGAVEFSMNDGATWHMTRILEPMAGKDAMVRWEAMFSLAPGQQVSITIRATDGTGAVQTEEFQLPQPDGASGRHQVIVSAV